MDDLNSEWQRKGATLSDKTARKEFGGHTYLKHQLAKTELARIDRELKRLRAQVADLEERRVRVMEELGRRRGLDRKA